MKIRVTDETWQVDGINLVPSDVIYQKLFSAIHSGHLDQNHLQRIAGHRGPVMVDICQKHIQYCSW